MEGTPFGRHQVVEMLGRGGMGDVWRAYDTVTDRVVAVKVLPAHLANERAAAELNNPHGMLLADGGTVPLIFADDRTSNAKWADLGIAADTFNAITPEAFEAVELGPDVPLTYDCVRNP